MDLLFFVTLDYKQKRKAPGFMHVNSMVKF
jgi:hypothetical protein